MASDQHQPLAGASGIVARLLDLVEIDRLSQSHQAASLPSWHSWTASSSPTTAGGTRAEGCRAEHH
jgi:hypothetical protein